jgi:tRNA dimethylallyltransferase
LSSIKQKKAIVIAGPTAVGKTAVAIQVAKHFNAEIISADSRQCYKELNIGVARPSPTELAEIQHHFIASHSIIDEITAASFETFALDKINELFSNRDVVVIVGGTGLYIKALAEGLDLIPAIDPAVRQSIIAQYNANGLEWLQQQVKNNDPAYFATGEIQNPQRMMRALEVVSATGHSILSFQKGGKAARNFDIVKIALELPKEELHERINNRVDAMMQQGLLEEVRPLASSQHLNALQTVGYAELFEFLKDNIPLENAIDLIRTHTRQYAKRQLTWFKRDDSFKWFSPLQVNEIINYLESR